MTGRPEPSVPPRSVLALPTEPYLGLTLAEAVARAAAEGRFVEVSVPGFGGRANLVFHRLGSSSTRTGW